MLLHLKMEKLQNSSKLFLIASKTINMSLREDDIKRVVKITDMSSMKITGKYIPLKQRIVKKAQKASRNL